MIFVFVAEIENQDTQKLTINGDSTKTLYEMAKLECQK